MRIKALGGVCFLGLALTAVPATAQQPINQERGIDPTAVYSGVGIDNVNLFGGNLSLAIPLGQRYRVGPNLSYGLMLFYNSHLWDFKKRQCVEPQAAPIPPSYWTDQAVPASGFNAGFGWLLTLGYLSVDDTGNITAYVGPDGGEHRFYPKLHEDDSSSNPSYEYTRDGSYLRLRSISAVSAIVAFPDGTYDTFAPRCEGCEWRVTKMEDHFGNDVTITYTYDQTTKHDVKWVIHDSEGRSQTVTFEDSPSGITRVKSVALTAFGGSVATYTLHYVDKSIDISSLGDTCSDTWPTTTDVTFLTKIVLPDDSTYLMHDTNGNPEYYTGSSGGADTSGAIKQLQLPTGGIVKWTYADWKLPVGCLYSSSDPMWDLSTSLGVATRQLCDSSGGNCATWSYSHPAPGSDSDDFVTTTVTSPPSSTGASGDDTEYFFRTKSCVTQGSYDGWDYGLPYETETAIGLGSTKGYLSSIAYEGTGSSRTAKRTTYVRFGHDKLVADPGDNTMGWTGSNRRLVYRRTVYNGDSNKYADVLFSSFDGLGHYRQRTTGGNFDAGNVRTTFIGFNPDPASGQYRTYKVDGSNTQTGSWGGWTWSTSEPWILSTFNTSRQTEGGVTAHQEECFEADGSGYPSTGFLRATRILKGSTRSLHDLLAVYTRNSLGQTVSEQYLGGDAQTSGFPSYCGDATRRVSGDQYRIDHTYQYGSLRTSTYVGTPYSFKTLDLDIDKNTGLPSASRDTAGIETGLVFDSMGRLTWGKPQTGQGAYVEHQYYHWTATHAARIESCTKKNGVETVCSPSTDSLSRSSVRFDSFGRPVMESKLLPGTCANPVNGLCFNERDTTYNAMGWVSSVSDWYPYGGASHLTRISGYDPFGRPGMVTEPDGTSVTFAYNGVRKVQRTVEIATSSTSKSPATTTETYDRQGRLYKVEEPSGFGGALAATTYAYDVGNHVVSASTASGSTTQTRSFSYDNRGFLLSEFLPERTTSVTYSRYDARGHAHRVVDGASNLTLSYDRAERLTSIAVTGGHSLTGMVYDRLNGVTKGFSTGKLVRATRYNWIGSTDHPVVETYTYSGTGGRVSSRTTTLGGHWFGQSFTWNDLGLLASVSCPQLSGGGSLLRTGPRRTLHYWYTNGFLTGVPGYASSISYYGNMMVKKITLGNGVSIVEGMDPHGMPRVASIETLGASTNWSSGAFSYDGAGNIKGIGSLHFIYDKVSRLTSGQVDADGAIKTQTVAYDAFGNITSTHTTSWGTQSFSLDHATNRLNWPATYDSAGRLLHWGDANYAYNELGQLLTVTGTGLDHTYLYTASGERIADINGLNNTRTLAFRNLDGTLLRRYTEAGTTGAGAMRWLEDEMWAGRTLLGTASPAEGKRFVAVDHLGSPRLICDRCAKETALHAYYPFGMEATDPRQDAEPTRFTGQETDLNTASGQTDDLVYMHARFYNPVIARFLSPDVLGGNAHAPQSFNLFAYVRGNPANDWDPFGMTEERYSFPIFVGSSLNPILWVTFFTDDTTVNGSTPLTFLDWMAFDPATPGWLATGSVAEGGGIMTRLARQPRVGDMNDLLKTMNSFQCDASWGRVFKNMAMTNSLGLRVGGFSLYGARNAAVTIGGMATGVDVASALGLPTIPGFLLGKGFQGMIVEGVSYTGLEAGVLTATGAGAEFALTWSAWQAGVFAGSVLNVAATTPCHYAQ